MPATMRIEFTIKNANHFKTFGIEDTSVKNILNLSEEKKEEMKNKAIQIHTNPYIKKVESAKVENEIDTLKPNDEILLNFMKFSIEFGMKANVTFNEMLKNAVSNITVERTRDRKKKQLIELYEKYLLNDEIEFAQNSIKMKLENIKDIEEELQIIGILQ